MSFRAGVALAGADIDSLRLDVAALSGRCPSVEQLTAAVAGAEHLDPATAAALAIALDERLMDLGLPQLYSTALTTVAGRVQFELRAGRDARLRSAALAPRVRTVTANSRELVATSRRLVDGCPASGRPPATR